MKATTFEEVYAILNQENAYYPVLLEQAKKCGIKNIFNIGTEKSHLYITKNIESSF